MKIFSEEAARLYAPLLLLCLPLLYFLNVHDYPLARTEVALLFAAVLILAVVLGILAWLGGRWLTAVIVAALLLLGFELVTGLVTSLGLKLLALAAVMLAGTLLLRRWIARATAAVSAIALVVMLALPLPDPHEGQQPEDVASADGAAAAASDLPPVIHVIMSDHIGVEGIPAEIPGGAALKSEMEEFYPENGFRLFTRAYSTHIRGSNSISAMVNFTDLAPGAYAPYKHNSKTFTIVKNDYFRLMHEKGYRIDAIQFRYLDFCQNDMVERCDNYFFDSIAFLDRPELAATDKALFIAAALLERSLLLTEAAKHYGRLVASFAARGIALPELPSVKSPVLGLATLDMWDRFLERVADRPDGRLQFFYGMLPHYPYMLEADCSLRGDPGTWLTRYENADWTSSPAGRRVRYETYFKQASCIPRLVERLLQRLQEAGLAEKAIVIVQSDHGPRINLRVPYVSKLEEITPRDNVDNFSTLFAVRMPGYPAGLDHRLLPLDDLFGEAIKGKTAEDRSVRERPVYIPGHPGTFSRMEMPLIPLAAE